MELIFPLNSSEHKVLRDIFKRESTRSLMIYGPTRSCKTSLLMQAAVSEAHNGSQVLVISPQKLSKLPPCVHGMLQPSSHTMKNISFLYAKSNSELRGYLSTLHLRPIADKPSVIIVDDLNYYCTTAEDGDSLNELVCVSKLTSLLCEAVSFPHHFYVDDKDTAPQTDKDQGLPGLVFLSWNTNAESSLKISELEEVAKKNCDQVWAIKPNKKKTTHKAFKMETENSEGSFAITFLLRDVNPTSQALYLQDVFVTRIENATSKS